MKIKYFIILSGLAVAFAAVSLWVIISGGNNAKAIKTKFKLGGLMLTVSSMLSLASCEGNLGGGISCYDPVMPEYVQISTPDSSNVVKVGDTIVITVKDSPCTSHSYKLFTDARKEVLQSAELGPKNSSYKISVNPTEYKGNALLVVYGEEQELGSLSFRIE